MPLLMASTKEQIVRAAERLFAQHGVDGVSLREIGTAAGTANNSAVRYHFGSKEQLIQAIFDYRLPRLHERRRLLISEREPDDLRGWIECQIRAVFEQSELDGSHYLCFVDMLSAHGRRDMFRRMPPEFREAADTLRAQLGSYLEHLPEPLRSRRIGTAMVLIVHVAASREHARFAGHRVLPFAVEVAGLVDSTVGLLQAPVSPAARRAVDEADPADLTFPMFI
ncbi:TetR/AcrR family transcriptional regulator [Frankia sp. CNm7]|uniref:TetR/AcrR family transcriptional regulator n=1 Tax=Frankia nepalensis TaxID=1836974 RepID=A0A937RKI0_9ACTN|nr:TetR/AcrR family transcriptional regulator [Frankia nepalensis]MBL7502363.1 TetR/AcrR family transcriptional regulator [Frankia nepalensis]MBL7511816.1 TetR/AcrR family transcriptional regulator [Frankia nepalensis]MBL7519854.1 TetR/AcrR family transcriptional regulator [Frankia nepalensis]MBL7630580.1 TetR/AcrR family transcriptional regulator [Frankia nepalensis]